MFAPTLSYPHLNTQRCFWEWSHLIIIWTFICFFLWTSLFVWHIGTVNSPRWFWPGGCTATLFLPTSVILSYCLPSHYLFYHVTFLYIGWFVMLSFSTSVVMACYLPPCQLSCHIIFLHIICPITLSSFTSVVLPLYLLPHQLSCHITFFYRVQHLTLPILKVG